MGQVGSIFGSAIVSLIVYHFMMEQLVKANQSEIDLQRDQKELFQQVINVINEGIIVVQDARIQFVNNLQNNLLSFALEVEDFFEKAEEQSIIENMDLLDKNLFKAMRMDSDKFLSCSIHESEQEPRTSGSHKNSLINELTYLSLRDIFHMSNEELEEWQFSYAVESEKISITNDLKKVIRQVFPDELVAIPSFENFQIRKVALANKKGNDAVYPSFILQFRDLSMNF